MFLKQVHNSLCLYLAYLHGTPQKSNELIPKIAMFKGSYFFQTIILGIQPLVFESVDSANKG